MTQAIKISGRAIHNTAIRMALHEAGFRWFQGARKMFGTSAMLVNVSAAIVAMLVIETR